MTLLTSFFSWWYGSGWKSVLTSYRRRTESVTATFSVKQLIRTLFDPWRRIISYPGSGLDAKLRAWLDNVISRAVGFGVRSLVLLVSLMAIVAVLIFTTLEIIVWPLLPLAAPILIIVGLT